MRRRRNRRSTALVISGLLVLLLLWMGLPLLRAGLLLAGNSSRHEPAKPLGLTVQTIRFRAADGVGLSGWFVPSGRQRPTIVLIPGFKADRGAMAPYARFLHAAAFNVLLYDSRGTGASGGSFTFGLREVGDVEGAVRYLERRRELRDRHYGLLGESLGSGDAIVAGSRLRSVRAIVADSPYVDEQAVVDRLDAVQKGRLTIPLAPLAPWFVDRVIGAPLSSFNPLRSAQHLVSRHLLLIHSRHDTNPTTPLQAAFRLKRAAGSRASVWIPPRGGHAGALSGQPGEYEKRVVGFFRRYLG